MDILFLCHCVPDPPDKGEKIRAHQELFYLARRYRVHLVCFARNDSEVAAARALEGLCESVYVERLSFPLALCRGFARFGLGGCLTTAFYGSAGMRRHVASLNDSRKLSAAVAYSSAMAPYAPAGLPLLLDMVDVDSEKWFQYAATRFPGFLYAAEGRRLRRVETMFTERARRAILVTGHEERLLRSFVPAGATTVVENGVDFDYFDPAGCPSLPALKERQALAFVGAMDYYPNAAGAARFAERVFPMLRAANPSLEFWIVGRNPRKAVTRLAARPGIMVTGSVPDVRPYLHAAFAAVAPLEIARGIQNKVLEALAMGTPVLASQAVCATFGDHLPEGVTGCASERDYAAAVDRLARAPHAHAAIREAARNRFSWAANLGRFDAELQVMSGPTAGFRTRQ